MNKQHQRDDALSAEYALGTLRGGARLRFQKRLQTEPGLAEQVANWQNLLSGLDLHVMPQVPPAYVWKKIALSLPARKRPRAARAYIGWMVAAALAALTLVSYQAIKAPEFTPLTVMNDAQHQGQWVVSADKTLTQLRVTPLQTATVAANNSLQLWLIPAGHQPVSLGLLHARDTTELKLAGRDAVKNGVIAISLEPEGGSPTGQPTGPVLYSGKI
ncbi:anti-sigma factor domain-containing protein [Pantoea sp. Fr+CA_20]|uniref:anti-sigma factor n=1 Tax=Pantoea TaxID=53335 RepID=UPI0021185A14|nr:anti-sigma factor [Pantoea sp. Fr+CA_20]